ncbi:hypothetical protein GCM10023337_12890 [Paenalcaligenes hermetiae]|uniref:Uncharacterized protein n=1 Tax=Paenalcaligenes hermetiae TaxID=1157987 RepID=A0ABP9M2F0_9BURK
MLRALKNPLSCQQNNGDHLPHVPVEYNGRGITIYIVLGDKHILKYLSSNMDNAFAEETASRS